VAERLKLSDETPLGIWKVVFTAGVSIQIILVGKTGDNVYNNHSFAN